MLRERGYAEIVPVAGEYIVDDDGALILITEYETMSSVERFWFAAPNVRMRTSTVKRFGGYSTASFCTETRVIAEAESSPATSEPASNAQEFYSVLGW
jgi:hypothetical protein